jgi:uncharacterized protein (DUF433 family)
MELVEVAFVASFRRLGVPLQRVRKARDYYAQRFEVEYPFAELRLQTEGHHVLMELLQIEPDTKLRGLIVGDAHGQLAWQDVISDRFLEFDYEFDVAVKWHVAGRQSSIVIDPRVVFGAPSITGVPTWALRGRRIAGEAVSEIAEDFDLAETDVTEALAFEGVPLAA